MVWYAIATVVRQARFNVLKMCLNILFTNIYLFSQVPHGFRPALFLFTRIGNFLHDGSLKLVFRTEVRIEIF